jgi:hypothetical protein
MTDEEQDQLLAPPSSDKGAEIEVRIQPIDLYCMDFRVKP